MKKHLSNNKIATTILPALIFFFVAVSGYANATLITKSDSFFPVLKVDGSSNSTTLSVLTSDFGSGESISDVNVSLDFTKCDNPIGFNGRCWGQGYSFNNEIVFNLISPLGTTVNLIAANTYSGQTPGTTVSLTFDDAAGSIVGGSSLVDGTFSPVGSLTDFIGEDPTGLWTLYFADTAGLDPLSLNSWSLDITTASVPSSTAPVPEPSSLALFGIGMLGLSACRRRRQSKNVN